MLATPSFAGPLNAGDTAVLAAVRERFAALNFAGAATLEALGAPLLGEPFHLRRDLPLYLRRVSAPTPLNTLLKLFVLDQRVPAQDVEAAFAPLTYAEVAATGLLRRDANGIRAAVRLSAFEGLLLAHDGYDSQTPLAEDHVIDVNPTTVTLATLTVRAPVRRALDVGTGCGALALLLARHSDQVVATDTNPRALNFAAFNAALNGVANVEWRRGSLFDPVAGERFDVVTCNPPYVISPETRYTFRDGGRRGDGFCEEVVRRVPEYLRDGAYASILCNWIIREGEPWPAALERWVAASGCDAWLLCTSSSDPLSYAAMWNRAGDRSTYEAALERWTEYAATLGIAAVGIGAVILRKREDAAGAAHWIRADRLPAAPIGPNAAPVTRFFDAQDALARLDTDEAMLAQRFRRSRDQRIEQILRPTDSDYEVESAAVMLQSGLRFRGAVDGYTTRLLALCDGHRTLDDIAATLAERGGPDVARLRTACAAIARQLVASGFLLIDTKEHMHDE
jgi:protein-L-isoaspartate O-methyltransferase